jgi:hypothetical protein
MKLRIKEKSIRLRLTKGEVDAIREKGVVTATTGFPGGRHFSYSLESSPANVNTAAFYSDNNLSVRLPETLALAWVMTEQVSIEGEQLLDDGEKLSILVEKDFACLTPRPGEDESDMFPNPDSTAC